MAINLVARLVLQDEMSSKMRQISRMTDRLTGTFNQASSAFTRAKRAMESYGSSANTSRNRMNNLRNSIDSTRNSMNNLKGNVDSGVGSLKKWAAGIMSVIGAQKLLNSTIGEAAKFEQSKVLIEAMFDDKKASDAYTKMVQRVAVQSPVLNSQDMFANSKSFISLSKNTKTLEKAWKDVEKLNVMDPAQGVEGAVLAMRELAGGDVTSLAERFEIPRKQLNAIKGLSFDQQVVALDKLLAKMNITDKVVQKMGSTTMAKWNQFKEKLSIGFRDMGTDALKYAKPAIDNMTKLLDSKAFGQFKNMVAQSLAGALNGINKVLTYAVQNKDKIVPVLTSISNGLHTVGSVAASVATAIINHWGTAKVVLAGFAAGFVALKAAAGIVSVFNTVVGVIKVFRSVITVARTAMLLFNSAILMNPITWLVAGIAAAIAIGVLLYKNWDKIKAKAADLWAGIKAKWASIKKSTAETWGNIQTKIGNAMSNAKKKVADFFSPLLSFIANAQSKWNSFKSALAHFKMPSIHFPSLPSFGGGGKKKSSKSNFHGIDRVPYDGYLSTLHKGERILTRKQADEYDKMQAQVASATPVVVERNASRPVTQTVNIAKLADYFVIREEADIDKIANKLADGIKAAWEAGA
ncbi:hypothetical protein [Bacillus smithii]|uniref:hypothetical protein n=1 Tax=Bacillus smithii TaxID=1479 RepID=UPI003D248B7F